MSRRVLTAFLCGKPSLSPATKPLQTSGSVTKNSDELWWTKFCVLNLFPVLLSHFPQPSQWHCGHFTRPAAKDSICLSKTVPWRAAAAPEMLVNERRETIPKPRILLETCGRSICISLKVTRADTGIMLILIPAQILCLSLRLVTHITKEVLDKPKWLTLSSFRPDVPQPFRHDSVSYARSELSCHVLFGDFRWLCTPD